jgi:hypothetical protein
MYNIRYYIPGIILILIGIIVVAVPEILVAFVASIIIMAGITALYIGHRIRKSEIEFTHSDDWFSDSDEDLFGREFLRNSLFRNRHR